MPKPSSNAASGGSLRSKTVQTAFRFPRELVGKIDRFARELEREHPLELTKPVTRAEAVRVLILRGLEFSRFQRDRPKREGKGARP